MCRTEKKESFFEKKIYHASQIYQKCILTFLSKHIGTKTDVAQSQTPMQSYTLHGAHIYHDSVIVLTIVVTHNLKTESSDVMGAHYS